jgi:UDP-N-acetylglucosamine 2-epimerase
MVGNSSAGIKEASFLGTPVVNIGTRQEGRMKEEHVRDVRYDMEEIMSAIQDQLAHGPYEGSYVYFKKDTSRKVAEILARIDLYVQKKFIENT